MKKRVTLKRLIVIFALIGTIGLSYYAAQNIFAITEHRFLFDPALSVEKRHQIQTLVEQTDGSFRAIDQALRACPVIESIRIERSADNRQYFSCVAKRPSIALSTDRLLLASGTVVESDCYAQNVIARIPLVTMSSHAMQEVSPFLAQWLLQLTPELFERYRIAIYDDYHISLIDKQNAFTIITSALVPITEEMRCVCERIFEQKMMTEQGTARPACYIADIRFENQIVLCSQKGGACNG